MKQRSEYSKFKAVSKYSEPAKISGADPSFGVPGYSYYFLAFAIALTVFFLVWATLLDSGEITPFIPAGIVAGVILIIAFFLREVVIRRARRRRFEHTRRLDMNLKQLSKRPAKIRSKLTVRRNQVLLDSIGQKSDAARVLKRVPDAHWEAFELCDDYLRITRDEIARTHINSPRFSPINKGRGKIKKLHYYHLLKWAEANSGKLTFDSRDTSVSFETRLKKAEEALTSLNLAIRYYPRDKKLIESHEAVSEYISTMTISNKTDLAVEARRKGKNKKALMYYNEALNTLANADLRVREKELIAKRIRAEMESIRQPE